MTPILRATVEELRILQTPDGKRFTEFMDALLQASVRRGGHGTDMVRTCQQTNIGDGGVDTEVTCRLPKGRCSVDVLTRLTHWQYKASSQQLSPATLKREIAKPYSRALVKQGSTYCIAFADEITAAKKSSWETALFLAAKKISVKARRPRILSGSELAAWASDYPGVVLSQLRPRIGNFITFEAWGSLLTGGASKFVDAKAWAAARARIRDHADLTRTPAAGVLAVRGGAGTGKSRLVYEALRELEDAKHLVLHVDNDAGAEDLRHLLVQYRGSSAVLVLDRPDPAHLEMLETALRDPAMRARVRVIAVEDDGGGTRDRSAVDVMVEPPSDEEVREILNVNRPTTDRELIAHVARLSGRNVRLALDFLTGFEGRGGARGSVRRYAELRVPHQAWREAMALSAMFGGVRVGGERDELRELAPILQLGDLRATRRAMREIGRATGFLQRRGGYRLVEPPAIASVAFDWAWEEWADDDPGQFFDALPEALQVRMLRSAARTAPAAIRRALSRLNSSWLSSLNADGLKKQPDHVFRLTALIELDPDVSLMRLLDLARQATPEALAAGLAASTSNHRTVQQELRWSLEPLLAYDAYWRAVERPLRTMAAISPAGGPLRELWRQVMTAELSGTPAAFAARTALLREIVSADDEQLTLLAIEGARAAYGSRSFRIVSSRAVLGGERLPEPEWRAKTWADLREGQQHALDVLKQLASDRRPTVRVRAREVLLNDVRRLLGVGAQELVRDILNALSLDVAELDRLVTGIDQFLGWDVKGASSKEALDYIAGVHEWLADLEHDEPLVPLFRLLHDRVRRPESERGAWEAELENRAATLAADRELLERALPFLLRARNYGVFEFGQALGRLSPDVPGVAAMLECALTVQDRGLFARAYVIGVKSVREHDVERASAAAMASAGPKRAQLIDVLHGARSAEKLIDDILNVHECEGDFASLAALAPYLNHRRPAGPAITRLLDAMLTSDAPPELVGAASDMAGSWFMDAEGRALLRDEDICGRLWDLAKRAAEEGLGQTYYWEQLVEALAESDPGRGVALLAHVLFRGSHHYRFDVPRVLGHIAHSNTEATVNAVGDLLLETGEYGWVHGMDEIIPALPTADWLAWMNRHGVKAARALAPHLPRPGHVDGTPLVPELTAHVLERHGHDPEVERRFASGAQMRSHSGDIEGQYLAEAEVARAFIGHAIPAIHAWAVLETRSCEASAEYWRDHTEEFGLG